MKYFVIADEKTVGGFSLMNVGGKAVCNEEEALKALKSAVNDVKTGYILVSHDVMKMIRSSAEDLVKEGTFPCIIEIDV